MRMNFSVPVLALVAGAALGYCLRPSHPAAEADAATDKPGARSSAIADVGAAAGADALRARIRELERLLAERSDATNAAVRVEPPRGERRHARPHPERGESPREFMERVRQEDPARFAQMTNSMARFRRARLERAQSRIDFLASVDTSTMTPAARETHEKLQDLIEQREEIEAKMHNPDLTDEEREAIFREMHEADRTIRRLNAEERGNLLAQTAEALGYSGEDAEEIVATVKDIIEATEAGMGRRGPGGPRGGHPDAAPPPPPAD